METLCFERHYVKRFARYKEFCNERVETVLDEFLNRFCSDWLEEEFIVQAGADRYERSGARLDWRNGHYQRSLTTSRGIFRLRVPRGCAKNYRFSLFEQYKRHSASFEALLTESILLGHSTRKAKRFFEGLLGQAAPSHSLALRLLKRFDHELDAWKRRSLRDGAMILILDAVYLKGFLPYLKSAKPVLCAWAIWPDGHEELLDFEAAQGESLRAWSAFCQRLHGRGLKNVRLAVSDDNDALRECMALFWPKALSQACIFHLLQNLTKGLKGIKVKRKVLREASWLFEAASAEEFYRWAKIFLESWEGKIPKKVLKKFSAAWPDAIRYYQLPKVYWAAARTTNRLERLFKELKRRTKAFTRFQNPNSGARWLYALLVKQQPMSGTRLKALLKSQQHS